MVDSAGYILAHVTLVIVSYYTVDLCAAKAETNSETPITSAKSMHS